MERKEKKQALKLRQTLGASFRTIASVLPGIFLFEAVYKIIVNLAIRPFVSWIFETAVALGGQEMVFNEQIKNLLFSPRTLFVGLLTVIVAAVFIYFEFVVVIWMAYYASRGRKIKIREAMKMALLSMKSLLNPGFFGFCIYAMLLLPFVNIGISSTLIPKVNLPNFVTGELEKTVGGALLLLAGIFVCVLLVRLMVFVLPDMVLARRSFGRSLRATLPMPRGTGLRIPLVIGVFMAVWYILTLLPVAAVLLSYGSSLATLGLDAVAGGSALQALLLVLALCLSALFQMVLTPLLLSLIVTLYIRLGGEPTLGEEDLAVAAERWQAGLARLFRVKEGQRPPFLMRHFKGFLVLVVALPLAVFVVMRAGSVVNQWVAGPEFSGRQLAIGHRGSKAGVENTLEAIQGAMDTGADYAEIDVLLSKDNVPMVIHDDHLKRLASLDQYVYEMTAAELSAVTLSQDGHEGHISTLQEVLQFCKGRQDLLIEFKQHGHETESVVQKTLEAVEAAGFADQAIYHTLVYDYAQEAKQLRPDYSVGYIIYGTVGRVDVASLVQLGVDFIVVEEGMFSFQLTQQATLASMPVFVWTVNDEDSMLDYYGGGATAVISDYPALARQAVQEEAERERELYDALSSLDSRAA